MFSVFIVPCCRNDKNLMFRRPRQALGASEQRSSNCGWLHGHVGKYTIDASASVSTREKSFVSAGFCPTAFAQTMYAKSALAGSGAATYLCVRKSVSVRVLDSLANGHPAVPSAIALLAGGNLRQFLSAH